MKTSNLWLDNYFIERLSFKLNKEFDLPLGSDLESPSLQVRCHHGNPVDETLERRCEVEIALTESSAGSFPYYFDIVMSGIFKVNPNLEKDIGEKLFRVNAPALLYSSAREIIFNLTSHTEHQAFLLPSVTFIDEDSDTIEEKKVKPAKATKTSKRQKKDAT